MKKGNTRGLDWLSPNLISRVIIIAVVLNLITAAFYLGSLTKRSTVAQQAAQLTAQKTAIDKLDTANQQANTQLKTVTSSYNNLKSAYDTQTANIRAGKYNTVQTQYVPTYQAPTYTYKPYNSGTVNCDTTYYLNAYHTTCR